MMVAELKQALRGLMRYPVITLVSILILASGIGASSALFSLVDGLILKPLPYPEPQELVLLWETAPEIPSGSVSGPNLTDWQTRARGLEAMGAFVPASFNLTGVDVPERLDGMLVTPEILRILAVEPRLGRLFSGEDQDPEEPQAVLLSHALWTRRFGEDPRLIGSSILLDGRTRTVVGVLPEGFDMPFPWTGNQPHEIYLPLSRAQLTRSRGTHFLAVLARLEPDAGLRTTRAEMDRVARELALEYPDTNRGWGVQVVPFQSDMYGQAGRRLMVVLGGAVLLLLVGCGNVGALQLTRALARSRAWTIRAALGARRSRLIRSLFLEGMALALAAGTLGIGLAIGLLKSTSAVLNAVLPRSIPLTLDYRMFAFGLLVSLITAVLFVAGPALFLRDLQFSQVLRKAGERGSTAGGKLLRRAFIVGQLSLSLILIHAAGLLVSSYVRLAEEDQGFQTPGVLTFASLAGGPTFRDQEDRVRVFRRLSDAIRRIPGVRQVAVTSKLPLAGGTNTRVRVEGSLPPDGADQDPLAEVSLVQGEIFGTLGIPLRRGRVLGTDDGEEGSVGAVVNAAFLRRFFPDGSEPLGRRISVGGETARWVTIVGVVGDTRQWGPEESARPEVFLPLGYRPWAELYFVVKADVDPRTLIQPIRGTMAARVPDLPPFEFRTMEERVSTALLPRRLYATTLGVFALLGLALAGTGLYGSISCSVASRTREVGLRIALGATRAGILTMVLKDGLGLTFIALGIGAVGVVLIHPVLSGLLYEMSPLHPSTFLFTGVTLLLIGVIAAATPAVRATRVAPSRALSEE